MYNVYCIHNTYMYLFKKKKKPLHYDVDKVHVVGERLRTNCNLLYHNPIKVATVRT